MKCLSNWTRNYKQKRLAGSVYVKSQNFLESTKNSHMFGLQYLVGAFLVVPRASTPALIDKVNAGSADFGSEDISGGSESILRRKGASVWEEDS